MFHRLQVGDGFAQQNIRRLQLSLTHRIGDRVLDMILQPIDQVIQLDTLARKIAIVLIERHERV